MIGWGPRSQPAARVPPRANPKVPPQPGTIISYLRIRNSSIFLHLRQSRVENTDTPGRYRHARCGYPNPSGCLLFGWGPRSQRAANASSRAHVEIPPNLGTKISHSPFQKSFHISITRTTRERKRRSLWSIPPLRVWKPQRHWVMDDWLGPTEPARGESSPPG